MVGKSLKYRNLSPVKKLELNLKGLFIKFEKKDQVRFTTVSLKPFSDQYCGF